MAAQHLHDLSELWYFLHLKKGKYVDSDGSFLPEEIWLKHFCCTVSSMDSTDFKGNQIHEWSCDFLLSNKKKKKSWMNCFLIALLYNFYVGILGNIPALQVRAFLRQQVAKTNKKKDLMSSPKSNLYSVPILEAMSWFNFQCNTDFTFLVTIYLTLISEFTGT